MRNWCMTLYIEIEMWGMALYMERRGIPLYLLLGERGVFLDIVRWGKDSQHKEVRYGSQFREMMYDCWYR